MNEAAARRAYWTQTADAFDTMNRSTLTMAVGDLRRLIEDAALAERAAEERQATADYHRQQALNLRAEVQRLESLLRQG